MIRVVDYDVRREGRHIGRFIAGVTSHFGAVVGRPEDLATDADSLLRFFQDEIDGSTAVVAYRTNPYNHIHLGRVWSPPKALAAGLRPDANTFYTELEAPKAVNEDILTLGRQLWTLAAQYWPEHAVEQVRLVATHGEG